MYTFFYLYYAYFILFYFRQRQALCFVKNVQLNLK